MLTISNSKSNVGEKSRGFYGLSQDIAASYQEQSVPRQWVEINLKKKYTK